MSVQNKEYQEREIWERGVEVGKEQQSVKKEMQLKKIFGVGKRNQTKIKPRKNTQSLKNWNIILKKIPKQPSKKTLKPKNKPQQTELNRKQTSRKHPTYTSLQLPELYFAKL